MQTIRLRGRVTEHGCYAAVNVHVSVVGEMTQEHVRPVKIVIARVSDLSVGRDASCQRAEVRQA
jgi:hypothetical protein